MYIEQTLESRETKGLKSEVRSSGEDGRAAVSERGVEAVRRDRFVAESNTLPLLAALRLALLCSCEKEGSRRDSS